MLTRQTLTECGTGVLHWHAALLLNSRSGSEVQLEQNQSKTATRMPRATQPQPGSCSCHFIRGLKRHLRHALMYTRHDYAHHELCLQLVWPSQALALLGAAAARALLQLNLSILSDELTR
jgi:hypothetical protein